MDGGTWWASVHGVANSRTRLSDFTFTFHFHALEKEMATHSSVLAWRIPGTGEPGGLPSMGSHRVGHDWSDLAAAAAAAVKFGKLSSGHRTAKGQFSFQSQRKAMPKNAQTTTHLHSSHMLVTQKAMAPHSSVLAWRIPGTGEPGGLPSMGSHRVGHD